ncbi:hypothetical protein M878_35705 [Streptomyces roseochromogenus subsp. oscitans DS 12.976]|uniref:Uncharacterized protein n=1 Tax=Streptomyces roseochromogenus subsp. oscitans DS 12.976 TaxID=1352936 RepID=V6JQH5_STRRC|nr:hypothetical protein M878_35705 [Streptomyces roseochromogenus subsp. oscitans DS 12.976]
MTTDAADAWQRRHEKRVEKVSAPYGPLALTATFPQCLNGLGAPPGSRTIRRGGFRTFPGFGWPMGKAWCSPPSRPTG